jgi:M-phase inducer tyrosine phosphatase
MDVDSDVPDISNPSAPPLDTLFYNTMSPRRSLDSPTGPQCRKRRSFSPEPARPTDDLALSSSPPSSSPTQRKVERISNGNALARFKPTLQGLGSPSANLPKRPRKLVLSACVQSSHVSPLQSSSAYPILTGGASAKEESKKVPTRRAFSALIPPNEPYSDESSFDGPDMSSPAQAYAKRQQVKTIRRCDGSDDLKPMTAIPIRDMQESPSNRFMAAGLPGFGDNEAHGKILPCHRVTEDGLMRINCKTVNYILVEPCSTNHVSSPLTSWTTCSMEFLFLRFPSST